MTDDEIRLFNEIMQNQSGEQAEGLATRYPGVFEVPRTGEIPDPLNMRKRMEDSERRRKEAEEAAFQEKYGQKTILDMARPEFIPDDITQAIQAIGTVGSGATAGIKSMVGEAFGMDPEAIMERNIYFPETVKKAQRGEPLTDEERRDLAFYGRYAGKIGEGIEKAEDVLAPVGRAYDASKIDALMFMPGTRNISMIDDIIEEGIGAARRAAPAAKMASEAAQMTAQQTADYVKELGATFDQLKPIVNLPNIQKMIREEFESPPIGAIASDALGFSSRLSESVDKLQDKGTGPQFLAQLKKMKGVPQKEIEATGLDKYLQGAGKVTKEDVQDFLSTNRVEVIEDERFAVGKSLDDPSKRLLSSSFDWLDPKDLNEEFEDVEHLRNTMIRALDRYIDDIEQADYDGPSRGSSELYRWREDEIDRIDTEILDFEDEIRYGGVDYGGGWMLPGGENYREILYKLPEPNIRIVTTENEYQVVDPNNNVIQTFNKEDFFKANKRWDEEIRSNTFRPTHYTNSAGTFGSIRATDRDIDGKPVLFAEEIQSDWAIAGAKEGYRAKDAERIKGKAVKDTGPYPLNQGPYWEVQWEDGTFSGGYNQASAEEVARKGKPVGVPDNPFRGNWYKPVVNNFLVKAAKEGKQGIGFPTGKVVSHRYDLSHEIDEINVIGRTDAVTGEKSRSVALDTVDGQSIRLGVDNDGKVDNVNVESAKRFLGKGLDEVIGKDLAKKIMEGGSQTISGEGLKVGGEGKDKLYDEMIPKQLKEIGDKYGVNLEKRTLPFGEKGATESEVYFFPITEEMRADLLNQGLPMFKQGGHVQKYDKGGKVLQGIAKGAKQAAKQASKQTNKVTLKDYSKKKLDRFLEDSAVKDRLYHGTKYDFSAFRPSLRLDLGSHLGTPEQANQFTMMRKEAVERGRVMPVYASIKNPLRLEDRGRFDAQRIGEQLVEMDLMKEDDFEKLQYLQPDQALKVVQKHIEDAGHDSVVYLNRREGFDPFGPDGVEGEELNEMMDREVEEIFPEAMDSYIVFKPTQIKSAIGNRGSFDPTNPDITKAKGGALKAAGKGAKSAEKQLKALKSTLEKARAAERTPVMPAPNRWFLGPEKFPGPQKVLERAIEASGRPRESFVSGAYIDPRTGQVLDSSVMSNVIVGIDPDTGRPVMSGLSAPDLTLPSKDQGPQTLSNLVRRNLYDPLEPGGVLDQTPFIATIEKSGPGHIYGLSTEYETPVELYNTKGTGNPTLRPKSRGDIYGLGDVVGQMRIKGRQKPHDVWEKLLVVPKGQTVKGGTKLGGGLGVMMMEEKEEGYNKGGALRSAMKGAREAADQVAKGQKMLQGVYRGYTGERLAEPVLSTTPQKRVAEYYANRRAAERGEDPHLEMLMVDPFAGKQYGLSLPIDQYNRDFITTRARAITPEDVAERIQLKKRGGLASLSR